MSAPADLADDLRVAVPAGQLFAVFQPQIDLRTGAIVGVEGLCRWRHPQHGLVAPQDFIGLAERSGAIHAIGAFILAECIAAASAWHARGLRVSVSANISPVQLASAAFLDAAAARLREAALPAQALTLELTETRPVTDFDVLVARLDELRRHGYGVSLDDYGTGHASPRQLRRLPLTELKLDRSLLQDEQSHPAEELSDVIARTHARGIRVVAEGIETPRHLRRAETIGCDRAQGYLLGRPMTRDAVEQLLA